MTKTFREFLKENALNDLKFRNTATKIAVSALKYISANGFNREFKLGGISNIPQAKFITLIPIENENKLGNTLFNYQNNNISIEIRIDKNLLSAKSTFLKTLIHELIHALDMLRIPKESMIQMMNYSKGGDLDLESYYNDPIELNAFYQEIVFTIEMEKKKFKDVQEFIKYAIGLFPEYFKENISSYNMQKIIKRLAGYYSSRF